MILAQIPGLQLNCFTICFAFCLPFFEDFRCAGRKLRSCKGLFQRHFNLADAGSDSYEIQPVQETFTNVLSMITEFTVNTLKFMSGQKDLQFLLMR
jgi:hypothetical protein